MVLPIFFQEQCLRLTVDRLIPVTSTQEVDKLRDWNVVRDVLVRDSTDMGSFHPINRKLPFYQYNPYEGHDRVLEWSDLLSIAKRDVLSSTIKSALSVDKLTLLGDELLIVDYRPGLLIDGYQEDQLTNLQDIDVVNSLVYVQLPIITVIVDEDMLGRLDMIRASDFPYLCLLDRGGEGYKHNVTQELAQAHPNLPGDYYQLQIGVHPYNTNDSFYPYTGYVLSNSIIDDLITIAKL